MTKLFLLGVFTLTGCAAHMVKAGPGDDLKTIGYNTGTLADDAPYEAEFARAAVKACAPDPYAVIEQSRTPSTLAGQDLPSSNYYWVVRCIRK